MLLKETRKVKRRKGNKLKKKGTFSTEKSTPAVTVPQNPDDSNSSLLTDVDPSEIEVICQEDFECESDHKANVKHKKIKRRKKKEVSCNPNTSEGSLRQNLETQKAKKNEREALRNETEIHARQTFKVGEFMTVPASSDISREANLETKNPKEKKKTGSGGMNVAGNGKINGISSALSKYKKNEELMKSAPKHKQKYSSTVEMSSAEQGKKVGGKRKIETIFEEAEMCMEEAVPKQIDKVKKMLVKGTKSAAMSSGREKRSERKEKPDHEDLSFKKSRVDVDTSLVETTDEGISSGLTGGQKILDKVEKTAPPQATKVPDIDPNKFIPVKTQKLRTAVPEFEEGGDSESDEDEEQQRMNLMEAFADDDIADEFRKEKEEAEEDSKPKTVDLRLPGWGSWGGIGINPEKKKRCNDRRSRRVLKFPGVPRSDQGKKYVIINDDPPASFKKQQVNDLPSEFPSVAAYEASIRAPIGNTWVPEAAHKALTAPPVKTKMGAIIQPLDESHLIEENAEEEAQKKFNDSIKVRIPTKRMKHKTAGHSKPERGVNKKNFSPAKKRKADRKNK